jgi:CDP-2,3-bis-(O-geranylgeranyl)-sn-glycerol synthase
MQFAVILQLLVLLLIANGTPVIAKRIMGNRASSPLDAGVKLPDGQPLFGRSKTIRGVLLALVTTSAAAPVIGMEWKIGAVVGSAAMAGDLLSSFLKRRLRLAPSSQAMGLDQVPESLFPFLLCRPMLDLTWADVVAGVAIFFASGLVLSRILYRLGVRGQPY